jgi:beta-N-acetylhexosaminidase
MAREDVERTGGSCLMVGFEGPDLDSGTRSALRSLAPGGIILFRRNLDSPERLASLVGDLDALLPGPLLLALDQEGGRVSRLEPWIGPTPSASDLARAGAGAARGFGQATARALRSLGFNMDLAPVVDLGTPGGDDSIGSRSFGADPSEVTRLAGAFMDGLQDAGVAGCLKHFPGLGRTTVDSHDARPRFERSAEAIEREDLLPYRVLGPRAAAVLVGHGAYPDLDTEAPDRPASLSPAVVGRWLRGRLGFRGLVATDDLEMGALRGIGDGGDDAVLAIEAGCDLLLYCRDLERAELAREAIGRRARRDEAFAARLREAAAAVEATARRWPRSAPDLALWGSARSGLVNASALTPDRGPSGS